MLHSEALCRVFLEARKTWVCKGLSEGDESVPVDGSAVEATKSKAASVDAWAGASSGRTSEEDKADAGADGATTKAEAACARNLEGGAKKVADKCSLLNKGGSTTRTWPPKLGASHREAKGEGPTQRRSHLYHRGKSSWSGGALAPVSGAPGAQAALPRTKPLLWTNAVCN